MEKFRERDSDILGQLNTETLSFLEIRTIVLSHHQIEVMLIYSSSMFDFLWFTPVSTFWVHPLLNIEC